MEQHAGPDPALSPDGRYRVTSTQESSEEGIIEISTSLVDASSAQEILEVAWRIDERLGDPSLGGEWISKSQFLIYETLDAGPLIVDIDQGVVPVLQDLLGQAHVPQLIGDDEFGLRAIPSPGIGPDAYHLLLAGVGVEERFPLVELYHAEDGSWETLPTSHVWHPGFSPDGEWLLLEERHQTGMAEVRRMWARRVEEPDGAWLLLADGADWVIWASDGQQMAYSDDWRLTWQTFPDGEILGRWNTSPYWVQPVGWSTDGSLLAAQGNVPGRWTYGLFVLKPD